jgi:hypothetical protein
VQVQRLNPVGKNGAHVQVWLRSVDKTVKGIAFQQGFLAKELSVGDTVNVACCLQENHWNGNVSVEIEVADVMRNT